MLLLIMSLTAAATAFDTPAQVDMVPLIGGEKLTCTYYGSWVAKELDAGEKGAARLSFVRYSIQTARPPCVKALAPGEKIIEDWSGYFLGAIGDLAVFSADDAWNGGEGFAIYDTTSGKKMFSDVAIGDLHIGAKSLSYRRVVGLDCVALTDSECIAKAKRAADTTSDIAAICKAGYGNALAGFENATKDPNCDATCKDGRKLQRESFWKATSIITYTVIVDRTTFAMTPTKSGKVECWPAE